jgi:hypothetical protein
MPIAKSVAAHSDLQIRLQRSSGKGRFDLTVLFLGEGQASLGRGHLVRARLCERHVASLS